MLKIRHYGFLSNPQKKTRLKLAQRLTRTKAPMFSDGKLSARELMLRVTGIDICRCRQCGGNLTSYNTRASPKGYNPIQSTSHSAPQNDRFFPVGRGILRTSGSLTTYRESTQHHFPEASCLFEGFCDGTNSIASRTAGRGFVHPAFCKNGARTVSTVPTSLFFAPFLQKTYSIYEGYRFIWLSLLCPGGTQKCHRSTVITCCISRSTNAPARHCRRRTRLLR